MPDLRKAKAGSGTVIRERARRRARTLALRLLCAALLIAPAQLQARPRTILFVGNSFTFGALSPVQRFHPERVTDLNGDGIGGVPALFKTFADEAGLDWTVSLETSPGKELAFHVANKAEMIDRRWDVVVLQGYSMLDAQRPGDPTRHIAAARVLADLVHRRNPDAKVDLVATWSRADETYRRGGGRWYGQPITRMADDLMAASRSALAQVRGLHAIIPVGTAWNRAIRAGLADPDPYDGIAPGQVDLWARDRYHASTAGYYLEALVAFGVVTGVDPRTLGKAERAAEELGLDPRLASRLRGIAAAELGFRARSAPGQSRRPRG